MELPLNMHLLWMTSGNSEETVLQTLSISFSHLLGSSPSLLLELDTVLRWTVQINKFVLAQISKKAFL